MTDALLPPPGNHGDPQGEFPVDPALAELVEQIATRLDAGDFVRTEEYVRRHPAWAEPIRRLLPTIKELHRLGLQQIAAGRRKPSDSRFSIPDSRTSKPKGD